MDAVGAGVLSLVAWMVITPSTPTSDLLLILCPPSRLVRWLDATIAAKQRKGEDVPPEILRWLERMKRIRAALPAEVDGVDCELIEKMIFSQIDY